VSEFVFDGGHLWGRERRSIAKVWLTSDFRVRIIKQGIDKAGSINKLGRELGYRSRVHPGWSIRQILLGKQAFPYERLRRLAEFLECPLEEILNHKASERQVTVESTRKALRDYGLFYYLPR
jgi:hypothetical protein